MPQTNRPLFEQIDSWLQEIDSVKTAAAVPAKPKQKTASTKKAAPAGMGESSHPSDDVDNNTQDADTGSRYSENAEDVKKDVPGQSVDETDANSGGDQDDKQFNIGTNQSAVGEDPSVEDDYKGDKDDPGTDHPMNADDVGEKYSSMNIKQLLKLASAQANSILADLANGIGTGNGAPVQTPKTQKAAATQPAPKTETTPPAAAPAPQQDTQMDKIASDVIAQSIKDAELDADLVGSYLHSYAAGRQKAAGEGGEDAPPEEGAPSESGDEAGAAGAVLPPEMGGGGGGEMPPEAAAGGGGGDVLGALGGLGGGEGGGMPPEAGAAPPGADGGAPGGMSQEQALQELAMALQELGISPEELAQMAQGQGQKLGSAVTQFKRAGKFRYEEAKAGSAKRNARDQIKDYILEITGSR